MKAHEKFLKLKPLYISAYQNSNGCNPESVYFENGWIHIVGDGAGSITKVRVTEFERMIGVLENRQVEQSKKHTVDLKALQEWQSEHKVVFATSTKDEKHLYCTLRGSYEVWHKGVRIYETMVADNAVEIYNSL